MSAVNYIDRLQMIKRIEELENEIKLMKNNETNDKKTYKRNESNENNEYIDEKYFKETQYIHQLKGQITSLINQNNILKIKIRELTEENEELKMNNLLSVEML